MQRLSGENWTNQGFQPDRWSSTVQVRGKIGRWDKGGEPSRHTRALDHRAQRGHHAARVGTSVLPGDRPLDSLPAPLRGTAQAGEIVAEALAPTQEETPEAAPDTPQDSPASSTPSSSGVLGDTASSGSSGGGPRCRGSRPPRRRLHHGPAGNAPSGPPPPPPPTEPKPPKPPRDAPKPGKPDRETRKEERRKEKAEEREKRSEKRDERREEKKKDREERSRTARTRRTTAAAGTDAGRQPRLARLTPVTPERAEIAHRTRPAAGEPAGALVLLHGRGADELDLVPLLDLLDPEQRLLGLVPRGPLALPPGGAHWYAVREVGFPRPGDVSPDLRPGLGLARRGPRGSGHPAGADRSRRLLTGEP